MAEMIFATILQIVNIILLNVLKRKNNEVNDE